MKVFVIFLIIAFAMTSYLVSDSDAFFEEGIVVEIPGSIMDLSDNVISPGETMFVNGTFNQSVDEFTANIFKNYENSRELVLTLSPSSNEYGDFSFNFTIPQNWKLGNYHIVLENTIQEMHWEFAVRKNHTGVTLDSTPYPMLWKITSPLKQLELGIPLDEIKCRENLILIQKYDGSPACVTESTKMKLIERGWDAPILVAVNRNASIHLSPVDITSANNQFAFNFYSHVSKDQNHNVFFSPTSIFTAFAIAYEGAKDSTAHEIQSVFLFDPDDVKRRADFADMQKQLNMKQQNNTISMAHALWIAENFKVLPEYVDTAKTHYNSDVESVDFSSNEKGIDLINSWVDEKTHGKIKTIFEELNPATKLVITNAIYFKGMWEDSFDKTKTTVGDFHVSSDSTVQVPMMQSKTTFPNIAINDLVQIVELPYEGEKFSMLILLPRDVNGIDSLEESLSVDNLTQWKGELQKMKTKVYMPKFKLDTEYDLKSVLQEMGIHDAFNDADFTGISNSGLYIEKAVHKAFVEVNEEGTEAAAATGIAMQESGPFEFTVDRPFIFIIQDNETGSILFIGKVVNPLQ